MKNSLKSILVALLAMIPMALMAQPGNPGGGVPGVPVDGGISLIVAGGLALGLREVYKRKRK